MTLNRQSTVRSANAWSKVLDKLLIQIIYHQSSYGKTLKLDGKLLNIKDMEQDAVLYLHPRRKVFPNMDKEKPTSDTINYTGRKYKTR